MTTVPQSQGDPKILKRGHNFEQKGDPNDVKGDPKFEIFHKGLICKNTQQTELKQSFKDRKTLVCFSNKMTYNRLAYTFDMINGLQRIQAAVLLRSLV